MGLREDKKVQARQTISNVATALFLKYGFDRVSVEDVARAAKVSKMTVFNYFPRKEDLLLDRNDEARLLVRRAILEREKNQNSIDGFMALGERLVAEGHPFARWTTGPEHFFRVIRESPSLVARGRELREMMETEIASALVEAAATPPNDATAHILAVGMVDAWRIAHAEATSNYHAGKRGDALGKVFLRTLAEALGPIRRAARGTPYGKRTGR